MDEIWGPTGPPPPFENTAAKPKPAPGDQDDYTEDALALAFSANFEHQLVHDHTNGKWFIWNGCRWVSDERAKTLDMCREFVRAIRRNGPIGMGKIAYIGAVLRAAGADPRMAVSQEVWDTNPMLLGVPGGVIDLATQTARIPQPSDFIGRQTLVAPAPIGAPAPLWFDFLNQLTNGDQAMQAFLQRLAGYLLTGDITEEVLTFFYGTGGNGKGVFLGALTAILHEYAVSVPIDVFTARSKVNLEYYRAVMSGARMVVASETEQGATWAESQIKEMTGNEAPLSARHPHGRPFTYIPQFKIVLVGNYAPKLRGRSPSMERRLRVVPCVNMPPKADPHLKDKLREEYPAILRWMLDGVALWQRDRLGTADAIKAATGAYFELQDAFSRWLEERCILSDTLMIKPGLLHADFVAWAKANGEDPVSTNDFAEMIDRAAGVKRVKLHGVRMVRGIGLQVTNSGRDYD